MDNDPRSSLATRPTLLFRLRDWKDHASWGEFYSLYERLVYGLCRKHGLSHEESEEVTQDVFKRVAETIQVFESDPTRGSFRGWLMNLTRWRITDKFRERHRRTVMLEDRHGSSETDQVETFLDETKLQQVWEEEWQRHVLDAARTRLATRVSAKHYQAFELHTQQQWPILKISTELGINPATLYVILHRLTKQLKAEVAQLKELG